MHEMKVIIREAIRHRRPMVGQGNGLRREFCPHALGHTDGSWRVLTWQFAGLSETGLRDGGDWRCFSLEDLRNLTIRNGEWRRGVAVSADYIREHIAVVDTAVDPNHGPEIKGGFNWFGLASRAAGTARRASQGNPGKS